MSETTPEVRADRAREVSEALGGVRERIEAACGAAGRDPGGVTLVVVTKTRPVTDVVLVHRLGVRDLAENRDQEASRKAAVCADLALRWHFVGRLQTNKARSVASYATMVHSLDRQALVRPLGAGARAAGRVVDCLLQVSLDGDISRGGAREADLAELADAVAGESGLRLRGIMAVAPRLVDPWRAFGVLPGILERLRGNHPGMDVVSAGMSNDLEAAVGNGATHLRVGSAVLGARHVLG